MSSLPDIFFSTKRLVFRPFSPDDLEALHALHNDPEVYRFVGDSTPLSRADAQRWIETSRNNVARWGYGTGAILDQNNLALIGWGGFARPENSPPELVYGFAPSYWGRGLGTEFLRALIAFAETLDLPKELRATVDPQNLASIALLEKFGFRLACKSFEGDPDSDLYLRSPPET